MAAPKENGKGSSGVTGKLLLVPCIILLVRFLLHNSDANGLVGKGGGDVGRRKTSTAQRSSDDKESVVQKTRVVGSYQEKQKRLPNFLLAGVQKAGTTAIFRHLVDTYPVNQKICHVNNPPGHMGAKKEAQYFDHQPKPKLAEYQALFAHCNASHEVVVDATPMYISYARPIYKLFKEHGTANSVKIMFVLREPASRELSWYGHMVRDYHLANKSLPVPGHVQSISPKCTPPLAERPRTFEEYLEAALLPELRNPHSKQRYSFYARWLRRWFALFDRRQIWIATYDEMKANPTAFSKKLHRFLNLEQPSPPPSTGRVAVKKNYGRNNAVIAKANAEHDAREELPSCHVQRQLAELFKPHNQWLYALMANHSEGRPGVEQFPFPKFRFQCKKSQQQQQQQQQQRRQQTARA